MNKIQKPVKIIFGLIVVAMLCVVSYWLYFNMRYEIVKLGSRPVRYDTWTNQFTRIAERKNPQREYEFVPVDYDPFAEKAPAPAPAPPPAPAPESPFDVNDKYRNKK
jgi:hypothetical protein